MIPDSIPSPLLVSAGIALAVILAAVVYVMLPERPTPAVENVVNSIATPIDFSVLERHASLADLERGRAYYGQLCIACHGATGNGHGEWAYRMTPLPADLTSARVRGRSDTFLFEVISDGVVSTAMAGFKGRLSITQRRQIVTYLRHLGARFERGESSRS